MDSRPGGHEGRKEQSMTKIEMMKAQLQWRIEDQERVLKDMRKSLESTIATSDFEIACWAVHYAERFQKAYEEKTRLNEELEMLAMLET